jgi:hypothetical protein
MRNGCTERLTTSIVTASIVTASVALALSAPAQAQLISFAIKGITVEATFLGMAPDPENDCIERWEYGLHDGRSGSSASRGLRR